MVDGRGDGVWLRVAARFAETCVARRLDAGRLPHSLGGIPEAAGAQCDLRNGPAVPVLGTALDYRRRLPVVIPFGGDDSCHRGALGRARRWAKAENSEGHLEHGPRLAFAV